jgi:hypothetical protein
MISSAQFSCCRTYRYSLRRIWSERPLVLFVGLNPSTADETTDDPTVRRCIGFARRWRHGGLLLVNLFAYRSTDPAGLKRASDPIGPENDAAILDCCQSVTRVVVAWGVHGILEYRDRQVLSLLSRPYCLGLTKSGAPRHPLYLSAATRLRRFRDRTGSELVHPAGRGER